MGTYTPNLNLYKPDASDDFGSFRQEFNDNMDKLDNGGGGGSGGHMILDGDGNTLPQEDKLQFTGACSVSDDNVNGRTVVDIKGNGLILNAQKYSDNEKVVGVWRDNKPLYQKTVHISALPSSATMQTYPHNIANIDKICHYEGVGMASSGSTVTLNRVGMGGSTLNGATSYDLYINKTNINISVGQDRSGIEADVTIWYTKTTDTAGSGGYEAYGFTPIIYSDTERKVGVWRDNKPLYKKTYHFNSTVWINANGWTNGINVDTTDVETLVDAEVLRTIGAYSYYGYLQVVPYNNLLNIFNCRNTNTEIDTITLFYTKISDVAGSGDYNTLGVPTVHYSTSEQVIGTWIDGKPLYEKTINFGALPNNESKKVNHNIANVKRIWIYDGYAFNSVSGYCNQLNLSGTSNISSQWYSGCTDTFVEVRPNSDRTAYDECYITVRYTKTTD